MLFSLSSVASRPSSSSRTILTGSAVGTLCTYGCCSHFLATLVIFVLCRKKEFPRNIFSRSLSLLSHGSLVALLLSYSLLSYQNITSRINQLSEPPCSSNPEEQQRPTKQTNKKSIQTQLGRSSSKETQPYKQLNHCDVSCSSSRSLNTVPVRGGVEVVPLLLQLLLVGRAIDGRRRSAYVFCQIALYRFWRLFSIAGSLFFFFFVPCAAFFSLFGGTLGLGSMERAQIFGIKRCTLAPTDMISCCCWGNGSDKASAHSGSRLTCWFIIFMF